MRIVDVCGFYAPRGGGVRTYVNQKLAGARAHGHDLTVIAPAAENRIESVSGGRIVWVESPAMPFDRNYHRFSQAEPVWRAMRAADPDVVEASSPWRSAWIAANWRGEAVRALIFHQDFVAAYPQTFLGGLLSPSSVDRLFTPYWAHLRRLSGHFDVTVTSGEWLARRLSQLGVRRTVAAPFGVEPGLFSPRHRDEALRGELLDHCGVDRRGRLLLTVGRLHPEKQHRTVLAGFARARRAEPMGLVVVGDGPDRNQIERQALEVGGVHFIGVVEDRATMARLFASADSLLHGSAAETYGLVIAEALASGLPVAAPAAAGPAELAKYGHLRLYSAGDSIGLAAALRELLDSQPAPAPPVPTSDEHFAGLFGLYERLIASASASAMRQGHPLRPSHSKQSA